MYLFLSFITLFSLQAFGCIQEENARSSYFNIKRNHKLVGHTLGSTLAETMLECGQFCLREENCAAFNYETRDQGPSRECELKDLRNSSVRYDVELTCDENYDYITMENVEQCSSEDLPKKEAAANCTELKNQGLPDGVYNINPDGQEDITVFCDQTTDGGGWTVIQRRVSPFSTSFNRGWGEYQLGFGNRSSEFWLGNDNIHRLTAAGLGELRIDLTASGPHSGFAKYSGFYVADSAEKYRWSMNWISANIGNAIGNSNAQWNQTGMMFSTPEQDNDLNVNSKCAWTSGWWYNWCGHSDLNRLALPKWDTWSYKASVIKSEMKVR